SALVPAGLHLLQAGPDQIAKLVAPDINSVQLGDAKVDVVTDKSLVPAGGTVHVTVTATADKRTKVPLTVLVYEQAGTGPGRVERPPARVEASELTLDVKNGKATQTLAFKLRGRQIFEMGGPYVWGHYTVLVMPPKQAASLEHGRRRVRIPDAADRDDPG